MKKLMKKMTSRKLSMEGINVAPEYSHFKKLYRFRFFYVKEKTFVLMKRVISSIENFANMVR